MAQSKAAIYELCEPLTMVVGSYGSGKTEVSVNLALATRDRGFSVNIADLDIVNPYFRCREAQILMRENGIRVVIPPGAQQFADLPIVVPEIKGMLEPREGAISIFDVGGDEVGARLLSSFFEPLRNKPYRLLQVINSRRPFTGTLDGCVRMKEGLERSSRLEVGGFIVNSHLIADTDLDVVLEGFELAQKVSEKTGVPIEFVAVMGELADAPEIGDLPVPILPLRRFMLPPWLKDRTKDDSGDETSNRMPAGRVKPLFVP